MEGDLVVDLIVVAMDEVALVVRCGNEVNLVLLVVRSVTRSDEVDLCWAPLIGQRD